MSRARRKAEARGRQAEWLTAIWLSLKGYRIFRVRAKTSAGELDLVAIKGDALIIVEVKARNSLAAGLDAVSLHQQQRLIRGAASLVARTPSLAHKALRFDVVIVRPWKLPVHLRNVLHAEGRSALDFN